jgi:hypothetical protein
MQEMQVHQNLQTKAVPTVKVEPKKISVGGSKQCESPRFFNFKYNKNNNFNIKDPKLFTNRGLPYHRQERCVR